MEYYGNNDWRDYKYLRHYGVKGMKWGKRKSYKYKAGTIGSYKSGDYSDLYLRKDSNNDDYGHKIGVGYNKKTKTLEFYNTKNSKYEDSYWKNPNKYHSKNKTVGAFSRTYAEDGVSYSINFKKLNASAKKITTGIKNKVNSFISKFSKKKVKKRK